MEWIKQKQNVVLLASATEKNLEKAYNLFLIWQKNVDFTREFSVSELNLLAYVWYKMNQNMASSNTKYNVLKGLFKKNILINTRATSQVSILADVLGNLKIQYAFVGDLVFNHYIYKSKGIRATKQFELIVEQSEVDLVIACLSKIGYYNVSNKNRLKPLQTFVLLDNTADMISIKLHFQPSLFYKNLNIIPFFLTQTEELVCYHSKVNVLKKEALFCYTFLANQHSNHFYWLVDWIELKEKYEISLSSLMGLLNKAKLFKSNVGFMKKLSENYIFRSNLGLNEWKPDTSIVDDMLMVENEFAYDLARILASSERNFSKLNWTTLLYVVKTVFKQLFT